MDLRKFGKTGMKFSPVGLGTYDMEKNPEASIAALRKGIEEGANHIDTAEMYGAGRVEEIVGDALQGLRHKVFIVSKVLPQNTGFKKTIEACENSLKRLKMDYLDCYLIHWREDGTPLKETFDALNRLQEQGKIRSFGVSNFDVSDMEESVKLAGEGRIACNQVLYHLNERSIESALIPWCERRGVSVVAYSPLGHRKLPEGKVLDQIAAKRKATAAQIAMAFLIQRASVIAIPKSSDIGRTAENVRAGDLILDAQEMLLLDQGFPAVFKPELPAL